MSCNENNYVKRLKKGKEDALEFIVDMYLPLVKGITYKVLSPLGNNGIIEECINDIFLSIWNNSNKFNGEIKDFKKWLCVIAKFKAIDYYRKEVKKQEITLDYINDLGNNSVEDEIITIENRDELLKVINTLEPLDKEIFIRKFFLGNKSQDIALALGITKASVDNRICRGKKKLKPKLIQFKLGVV
ncbi:sigma-70 family RNA polymerase sigma factor [Clostridium tarantellae]|uniref:Sigma-70 family RNA polymerase sigma factor n=1 Tax=Clostridium tarantellae TaxID=39493 RepID=A0A6I1MRB2_9CLOT|nr:sigma-70 family RNA polymerase sigma factor [Clostridium tarantellae]MPQ44717.1 sigma-70 family RNA polymerase sigma factor [Clostridium tarantellae]